MKKLAACFVLSIFVLASSFGHNSAAAHISGTVKQFILKNQLPITIGEKIIIYDYIDTANRIKFQVFILNLLNTLTKQIAEGLFDNIDDMAEKIIELQRILTAFYNYCAKNNFELAIIINNFSDGNKMIADYLKHFGYSFVDYNGLIILDNDTHYTKLIQLIDFLFQINILTTHNLINYFRHDRESERPFKFRRIAFIDGKTVTVTIESIANDYFDITRELALMVSTNNVIGDILFIFSVRNYSLPEFENMWNRIIQNNIELEKAKSEWFNNFL